MSPSLSSASRIRTTGSRAGCGRLFISAGFHGKSKQKRGPAARRGLDPDAASMRLYNLSADHEAQADSRYFSSVETFEWNEQVVPILLTDSDSVVLNRENPSARVRLRLDVDPRSCGGSVLERVVDQISKERLKALQVAQ